MDINDKKFYDFVIESQTKFRTINWDYGPLTLNLKFMYIVHMYEKFLKKLYELYITNSNIFNNILQSFLSSNDLVSYNCDKYVSKDVYIRLKMKFFKYMKNKNHVFTYEQKEEYINYVEKHDPVYEILKNKKNSKTLKKLPNELIRMLDDFI